MIKKVFGEQSMSLTAIEEDDHTKRAINCTMFNTVAKVKHLVRENQHEIIEDLADEVGIGYGTW